MGEKHWTRPLSIAHYIVHTKNRVSPCSPSIIYLLIVHSLSFPRNIFSEKWGNNAIIPKSEKMLECITLWWRVEGFLNLWADSFDVDINVFLGRYSLTKTTKLVLIIFIHFGSKRYCVSFHSYKILTKYYT